MADENDKPERTVKAGETVPNLSDMLAQYTGAQYKVAQMLKDMNLPPFSAVQTAAMMAKNVTGIDALKAAHDSTALAQLTANQRAFDMVQKLTGFTSLKALDDATKLSIINVVLPKVAFPDTAYTNYSAIAEMARAINLSIPQPLLRNAELRSYQLAAEQAAQFAKKIQGLPDWMKPITTAQVLQPSWEIAAGLGLAGAAKPGLIRDVMDALHKDRTPTTTFEASVQMMEAFDGTEIDLSDRAADVLRTYAKAILEFIGTAKDEVVRAGLISILSLLLTTVQCVQNYEAQKLSPSQLQMQKQIADIDKTLDQILQGRKEDRDIRIVAQVAWLRGTPDAKGLTLRRIYPDDRVRVIGVQGNWAQVEVFEYHSENVTRGWVNRRLLRIPSR